MFLNTRRGFSLVLFIALSLLVLMSLGLYLADASPPPQVLRISPMCTDFNSVGDRIHIFRLRVETDQALPNLTVHSQAHGILFEIDIPENSAFVPYYFGVSDNSTSYTAVWASYYGAVYPLSQTVSDPFNCIGGISFYLGGFEDGVATMPPNAPPIIDYNPVPIPSLAGRPYEVYWSNSQGESGLVMSGVVSPYGNMPLVLQGTYPGVTFTFVVDETVVLVLDN